MNTNTNFTPELPDFERDLSGAPQAAEAGLPDPATLAKLATELYQGMSSGGFGGQQIPPIPEAALSSVTLPVAPPANFSSFGVAPKIPSSGQFSEAELQALANDVTRFNSPPSVAQVPEFSSPGIPGGFSAGDFSTTPTFSFIEEARSLFEQTSTLTSDPRHLTPALTTPQIPGSVPHLGDARQPSAFQFLETARSVSDLSIAPSLAPVGNDPNLPPQSALSVGLFDVQAVRRDFPILQETVNGRPLIWLDNAATTQKPQAVIDRLSYFYEHENSNVHRAAHTLAARSTDAYDAAREKVRRFLNAGSTREIVFVRGATEGINLVAKSWGHQHVNEGDEIVITHLEHHANIVPWQMLCAEKGARLRITPVDNHGQILLDEYEKLLGPKTRLVALAQVSNALGTVTPVPEMVEIAHRYGAKVLVDGAQAVSHMSVDVQAYDCDFYVFSGHKVFAPTGIGVVYGKQEVLDATPPWQGGGNMIVDVTFEKTVYHPAPFRFEAGTGSIADAVGLGAAIDYLDKIGMVNVARYEHDLLVYATEGLQRIPGLHLIGTAREKASVLSFVLDDYTTEEVGQALSSEGIAVRSGHHCAQPILRRFGLESTVRPSLAFYNTCEEIDVLIAAIWNLKNGKTPGVI